MRHLLILLITTALLGACAKKEVADAPAAQYAGMAAPLKTNVIDEKSARRLAYEHTFSARVAGDQLSPLFSSLQAKCLELKAEACEVLETSLSTGRMSHAFLKLRLAPAGTPKIMAALNQGGTVVQQSTQAEDLDAPITDTQRRLAIKTDYRAKLEDLKKRSANDVDALIKVHRELSEVQSEIEALTATDARLIKRVKTEIVNINLQASAASGFWQPIGDAFSDFFSNLSQGLATVVNALPFILPWLLVLATFAWVARKLWARRRHRPPGA